MNQRIRSAIIGLVIIATAGATIYALTISTQVRPPSPAPQQEYTCPNKNSLELDKTTQTYIQWNNCMPAPGFNEPCSADAQYEQWVNDHCGLKFKINIAE